MVPEMAEYAFSVRICSVCLHPDGCIDGGIFVFSADL